MLWLLPSWLENICKVRPNSKINALGWSDVFMLLRRDLFLLHHWLYNAFDLSKIRWVFLLVKLVDVMLNKFPLAKNLNDISCVFSVNLICFGQNFIGMSTVWLYIGMIKQAFSVWVHDPHLKKPPNYVITWRVLE